MNTKTKFENSPTDRDSREVLLCQFWRKLWKAQEGEVDVTQLTEAFSFVLFFLGLHGYRFDFRWNAVKNCFGEIDRIMEACTQEGERGIFRMGLKTDPARRFSINAGQVLQSRIRDLTGEENKMVLDACDLGMLAYTNGCDLKGVIAAVGRPM